MVPHLTTAYLGLGSNLGDRAALIAEALARLEAEGVRVCARAPLYETDPVTAEPQPLYLNGAARVETALAADELLALCLAIERVLGRERPPGAASPAPRPIDIDLLLFGDAVVARPTLVLPHPRLLERPFVRIPLADVAAPGLRHLVTGEPLDHAAPDAAVRAL
ncbi:MAG TPA: 2-amino-4-hydroxy-6-hydroxymethyldihydropteridine diphosphokinase [Polyangia bacterium]|jgi:2-amino-4-hydroxy-6-hydroxymethyldihydropteridine diphosphokinase|nr:2-amino-4-hydroxy-6-hydroxymethyldihydropteridine diphosphokinase [Polyangia bacterium]